MAEIGMNLPVTLRSNIWTSNGWRWFQLDQVLDIIETNPTLKQIQNNILDGFLQQDGWISSEGQEVPDDYLITPNYI